MLLTFSTSHGRRAPRRAATLVAIPLLAVLLAGLAGCGTAEARRTPNAAGGTTSPLATATTEPPVTTSTLPRPLGPGPATVSIVADSVILGAVPELQTRLQGWQVTVDAKVSRSIFAGISILQAQRPPRPRVVVIELCTNWSQPDFDQQIDRAMATLGGVDRVIWVTCTPWNPYINAADAAIGAASVRYHNVVVADWAVRSATPGYTYADHIHLRPAGALAMADLIAADVGPPPTTPPPTGSPASTSPP
jgi:hypothetical protein